MVSCTEKKQDAINNSTIFLLQEPRLDFTLNTLFDGFEYIALETKKESLFGTINKLIVHDDKYFILDKVKRKKVLIFAEDGTFIRTIGSVGKGPGEYSNMEDFTIDEATQNIVILGYPSIVYVYDFLGKFLFQKKLTSSALLWNISNCENGYIFSSNHQSVLTGEEAFLLFTFDRDFNLLKKEKKLLPVHVALPTLITNPFFNNEQGSSYFDFFTSTLYANIGRPDSLTLKLDFEGKEIPVELYANPQELFSNMKNYVFFLHAQFINNHFVSMFIRDGIQKNIFIYDIKTHQKTVYKCESWFPNLSYYKDNYFYSSMESLSIINGHDYFNAENKTKYPIEANSNSVILKIKPKSGY